MNREELIKYYNEEHEIFIKKLNDVNDLFFKYCDVWKSYAGDITIVSKKNNNNYPQFVECLKLMKSRLGNYTIESYWIPYENCVCVNYAFMGQIVRFSIIACDLYSTEDIIKKLSNGKCKVSKTESFSVECSI